MRKLKSKKIIKCFAQSSQLIGHRRTGFKLQTEYKALHLRLCVLLSYVSTFSVIKIKRYNTPLHSQNTSVSSINKDTPQLTPLACSQKD